jgi:hypothetical protein
MEAIVMPKAERDLYQSCIVGYNQDAMKECVITFNSNGANLRTKADQTIKKLKAAGFNWIVLNRNKKVLFHSKEYEKVSIIPSTREYVFVYFFYEENDKTYSFCRLSKIKDINETCTVNVSLISRNPNWIFKEYLIKEYFDHDRINLIMKTHFEN